MARKVCEIIFKIILVIYFYNCRNIAICPLIYILLFDIQQKLQ
jgi:hypothetical protein